jgi:hypothetical protein
VGAGGGDSGDRINEPFGTGVGSQRAGQRFDVHADTVVVL